MGLCASRCECPKGKTVCALTVQVEAHTKASVDKVCCAPQNALKSKCLLQKYWQNILIANATKRGG